jgi:UDP-N-acetylglucosamine 2-epimerase (non-hydrolysing)
MSHIFSKLDKSFNHTLVHTGQHYDKLLSDVFFDELNIRKPDYNLGIGSHNKQHYHQQADLSVKIIELIHNERLSPDIILFLGDSNSVLASVPLKKEGFKIGHIEAGMRSGDKHMLEEINRIVCDHCSDLLFVYHDDYKGNCIREGIDPESVFVVGNTIVEVCNDFLEGITSKPKTKDFVLMDIHRPENFKYAYRMKTIIEMAHKFMKIFSVPVYMLNFTRTFNSIQEYGLDIGDIQIKDLMPYKQFLKTSYDALFVFSDSGTAQEESALLDTSVIVPRDFTERPQSVVNKCSFMIDANSINNTFKQACKYIEDNETKNIDWLGNGTTSSFIEDILKRDIT